MRCNQCHWSIALAVALGLVGSSTYADMTRSNAMGVTQSQTTSGGVTDAYWNQIPPEVATQEWELDTQEWERYLRLMQGRARYFAAQMPPPMVLAMFAKDDAERNHYAELLARYENDRNDRLLAVQSAYDDANTRLFPGKKIIDLDILRKKGLLPPAASSGLPFDDNDKHKPRLGDRIVLFAAPGCEETCGQRIRTIVTQHVLAPLEVYFIGEQKELKEWVKKANLEVDWLKEKGVTFSKDEGQAQQYQATPGTTFIVRGEALYEMAVP